jgi:hypothetical protein
MKPTLIAAPLRLPALADDEVAFEAGLTLPDPHALNTIAAAATAQMISARLERDGLKRESLMYIIILLGCFARH